MLEYLKSRWEDSMFLKNVYLLRENKSLKNKVARQKITIRVLRGKVYGKG